MKAVILRLELAPASLGGLVKKTSTASPLPRLSESVHAILTVHVIPTLLYSLTLLSHRWYRFSEARAMGCFIQ